MTQEDQLNLELKEAMRDLIGEQLTEALKKVMYERVLRVMNKHLFEMDTWVLDANWETGVVLVRLKNPLPL